MRNQSSYRLNSTIWFSVAFTMRSPNFSSLMAACRGRGDGKGVDKWGEGEEMGER